MRILSLPMFFPRSVNGRRLGILMLGMTSCGALPLSIIVDSMSRSSSPLDMMAWLAASSSNEHASEFRREPALLSSDGGAGDPRERGVKGLEMVVWDARRVWNGEALPLTSVEGTSVRSASSSSAFDMPCPECLFLCLRVPRRGSGSSWLADKELIVVSRLSTPYVLSLGSRCLGRRKGDGTDSPMDFSSAKKQVICGVWPRGARGVASLSEKLGGRDDAAKASSPDRGRMPGR